jgi:hypothetical protein
MAAVAGWSWRQRIRHRHFTHLWHLRLNDWTLECTRCHATRPDRNPQHLSVPRADELDYIKESSMVLVQRVWKAVAAGVSSGIAAWAVAEQAGSVETGQLVAIVLAALGVALTTYLAPPNQTA